MNTLFRLERKRAFYFISFILLFPSTSTSAASRFFGFDKKTQEEKKFTNQKKEAKKQFKKKNYNGAIQWYDKAIKTGTNIPHKQHKLFALYYQKALAHYELREYTSYASTLQEIGKLPKNKPEEFVRMASLYKKMGDYLLQTSDEERLDKALCEYKKATTILERPQHKNLAPPILFHTYEKQGSIYKQGKNYHEAMSKYVKALNLVKKYPEKMKNEVSSYFYYQVGSIYFTLKNYKLCIEFTQMAYEIEDKWDGPKLKLANYAARLSMAHAELGNEKESAKYKKKAYKIRRKRFGTQNSFTQDTLLLGKTLQEPSFPEQAEEKELSKLEGEAREKMKKEEYSGALEIYEQAIALASKLPKKKQKLMAYIESKALAHHALRQTTKTIESLKRLVALHLKEYPIDREEVGGLYKQIADRFFIDKENFKEAEKSYKNAVENFEKQKGKLKEPLVLFSAYVTWAYILRKKEKYTSVVDLYTKALTLRESYPGKIKEIQTPNIYYLRAKTYFQLYKYQEALESAQRALKLEKKHHKKKSAKVAIMEELLSAIYFKLGQQEKEKKQQEEAYQIRKKVHGKQSTLTKESFQMLQTMEKGYALPPPPRPIFPKSSAEEASPILTDDGIHSEGESLKRTSPLAKKEENSRKKWFFGLPVIAGLTFWASQQKNKKEKNYPKKNKMKKESNKKKKQPTGKKQKQLGACNLNSV